ncbi:MAG: phosphoribosyltransferase family protein [Candidatus Saccharibacteria bacterium]|nr:phosphoribosyltransferase family protein [Candidatus Saccharibacteria bacterium]
MIDKILQNIAPHHCYSCQKIGNILCDSCIYNIANETENTCIECRRPTVVGSCSDCNLPFTKAWVTGVREAELARVVGDFKWARAYEAHQSLALLLDQTVPILPKDTIVVFIPTISHHKRIRGYDHAELIARSFAGLRKLHVQSTLSRMNNTIQHKATKIERRKQAELAFACKTKLDRNVPYLIIDDVVTTGSTIKAATRVLKGAGANEVWVAAIARQPLN